MRRSGQGHPGPAPSRRLISPEIELFDLLVRDEPAGLRLPQAFLNLEEQAQPLNCIIKGRVLRKAAARLDCPILVALRFHLVNCTSTQERRCRPARPLAARAPPAR